MAPDVRIAAARGGCAGVELAISIVGPIGRVAEAPGEVDVLENDKAVGSESTDQAGDGSLPLGKMRHEEPGINEVVLGLERSAEDIAAHVLDLGSTCLERFFLCDSDLVFVHVDAHHPAVNADTPSELEQDLSSSAANVEADGTRRHHSVEQRCRRRVHRTRKHAKTLHAFDPARE